MSGVDERPEGAKFRAVSWGEPGDIQRWLSAVEAQADDLQGLALDRVRRKRRRLFSRYEARRRILAASRALDRLMEAAKAGLRPRPLPDPPSSPPEEAGEGEPPPSERRPIEPSPQSEGA